MCAHLSQSGGVLRLQYITSLLFFTGLLIRPADMPKYWEWFSYLNFLKYSWGALMKNQFEGDRNMVSRALGLDYAACRRGVCGHMCTLAF
jgi:hypothetical protein